MICPDCRLVVPEPRPLRDDYPDGGWSAALDAWRARTSDTRGMCTCTRCQRCWDLVRVRGKLQVCHCGQTLTTTKE